VGDRALREVAIALQNGLRSYDLCVRYAGDEFIVVLADCTREGAEAKRRELQQRVSEIEIEARPGKRLRLAASAGAAVFPYDGSSYETLLADADQRMYRDKAARRGLLQATYQDRVQIADADVFEHQTRPYRPMPATPTSPLS
jgi:diguanylate cyclase (GGDEF)-like protein